MHELDIVIHIVKTVEDFAIDNRLTKIDTLVLQVGELSGVIPRYIEACYPAVVEGTSLQETKLKIEIVPGNALCKKCNKVFNLLQNDFECPHCGRNEWDILCGRELMIKEVIAC